MTREALRAAAKAALDAWTAMPDAGLTNDDPRYDWWYRTAAQRGELRAVLAADAEARAGGDSPYAEEAPNETEAARRDAAPHARLAANEQGAAEDGLAAELRDAHDVALIPAGQSADFYVGWHRGVEAVRAALRDAEGGGTGE